MEPGDVAESLEPAGYSAGDSSWRFVERELERPKISFLYRTSLVAVSFAMVLLPLLYLALVAAFACGVCWYAIHFSGLLEWPEIGGPRVMMFRLFLYAGPIFAGIVLTFFLVKPIFAPKQEPEEPFSLNHSDAPKLFVMIGWLCRTLGAPIPSRIDVSLDVNAAAGFRTGWRSLLGNDIVLVIGLPLVAGMSVSELAAVIAHEYGHFSQGAAMRASYVIRRINAWFFRVVYVRDRWDWMLYAMSEAGDESMWVRLIMYLARLGVWFSRSILWVLMMAGHALSCVLERQMEFDADQYAMKVSGTATFIGVTRRLQQLSLGATMAEEQMVAKWKSEKKLHDHIPDLIASRAREAPAELQDRYFSQATKRKTRLFDTHPSDAERIRRATEAGEPGVFHATAPAGSLFADFSGFCRRMTALHYEQLMGSEFSPGMLVSTEETAKKAVHDYAPDEEAVKRFFLGVTTSLRPIILTENMMVSLRGRDVLREDIDIQRRRMVELQPGAEASYRSFKSADERLSRVIQASHLLQAGVIFDPGDFGVGDREIEDALREAREARDVAGAGIREFEDAGRDQLIDALQLLRIPQVAATIPGAAQLREEATQMVWTLSRLGEVFEPLLELRRDCAALDLLLRVRQEHQPADNLAPALEDLCAEMQERINLIQEKTASMRYPFQHTTEQIFVNQYAKNTEHHPDPFELVLREGRSHTEKLIALYYRVLSNLIRIATKVTE